MQSRFDKKSSHYTMLEVSLQDDNPIRRIKDRGGSAHLPKLSLASVLAIQDQLLMGDPCNIIEDLF
jgi:hypothetical protein